MAKRIAETLKVPFSMNDATTFTQAGYVGDDVEQCISRLLQVFEKRVAESPSEIYYLGLQFRCEKSRDWNRLH